MLHLLKVILDRFLPRGLELRRGELRRGELRLVISVRDYFTFGILVTLGTMRGPNIDTRLILLAEKTARPKFIAEMV